MRKLKLYLIVITIFFTSVAPSLAHQHSTRRKLQVQSNIEEPEQNPEPDAGTDEDLPDGLVIDEEGHMRKSSGDDSSAKDQEDETFNNIISAVLIGSAGAAIALKQRCPKVTSAYLFSATAIAFLVMEGINMADYKHASDRKLEAITKLGSSDEELEQVTAF